MNGLRPTRLLLFRHAQVEGGKGIFYSQQDVPLSREGRLQVRTLCSSMKDHAVSMVISSDLARCMFQAEALGRLWGCEVRAMRELREVHFGDWTGLSWDEIEQAYPGWMARRMADLARFRPPNGENLEDVRERVLGVLMPLMEHHQGETLAVVSHGGVNRVILASVIGLSLQNIFVLGQDFGCLNVLDFYPDGYVVLKCLNMKDAGSLTDSGGGL